MMTFMLVVLSVSLSISLVANYYLFKAIKVQLGIRETYEKWILEFRSDVNDTLEEMRAIDRQNMFEKDDDVGGIFQNLLELIEKLNNRSE